MGKHSKSAVCHRDAFDDLVCSIPFSQEPESCRRLIDRWKTIPYRYRAYDPDSKVWRFMGHYKEVAIEHLLRHFPDAEVPFHSRARTQTTPTNGADHFRVLHLRETAPVELIEASYRVLARLNHPDTGGSTETMQAINGAYAALKERVSA